MSAMWRCVSQVAVDPTQEAIVCTSHSKRHRLGRQGSGRCRTTSPPPPSLRSASAALAGPTLLSPAYAPWSAVSWELQTAATATIATRRRRRRASRHRRPQHPSHPHSASWASHQASGLHGHECLALLRRRRPCPRHPLRLPPRIRRLSAPRSPTDRRRGPLAELLHLVPAHRRLRPCRCHRPPSAKHPSVRRRCSYRYGNRSPLPQLVLQAVGWLWLSRGICRMLRRHQPTALGTAPAITSPRILLDWRLAPYTLRWGPSFSHHDTGAGCRAGDVAASRMRG